MNRVLVLVDRPVTSDLNSFIRHREVRRILCTDLPAFECVAFDGCRSRSDRDIRAIIVGHFSGYRLCTCRHFTSVAVGHGVCINFPLCYKRNVFIYSRIEVVIVINQFPSLEDITLLHRVSRLGSSIAFVDGLIINSGTTLAIKLDRNSLRSAVLKVRKICTCCPDRTIAIRWSVGIIICLWNNSKILTG